MQGLTIIVGRLGAIAGGLVGVSATDPLTCRRAFAGMEWYAEHIPNYFPTTARIDMFKNTPVFSGCSVDDLAKAKAFYGGTLGFDLHEMDEMGFGLRFANGGQHFFYPKADHQPAAFTVLNFPVDDIDRTMEELAGKGVTFEQYGRKDLPQDEKGVLRGLSVNMGPDIAWFKDPAGNILSVLQEKKNQERRS